jgi:hypothetical protein
MKLSPKFYPACEDKTLAWQKPDLIARNYHFAKAKEIWYQEWLRLGSPDEGSCCGGKGIELYYLRPRARACRPVNVVSCDWVQGNISASRSVQPALDYLKSVGIEDARYNDGWMD